ncbi:MAG: DUF1853 family protein [Pseudomonadota bacterium]|nr:DUF1853 family protein [Pseudomonadota bacterium]
MLPSQPAADHDFFSLPHQYQRDRLWSLAGPPLLDCHWSPRQPAWLTALSSAGNVKRINALPAPDYRSQRLGLMFEAQWQQIFSATASRSEANRQIISHGRTLGELDLLTELQGQHWHFELALKFYLSREQDWIGPNSRDRLFRKLRHTAEKQLQLSHQPQVSAELATAGWDALQSQAIMRGCLFYPAGRQADLPLPPELNPDHWRGWWCYAAQAAGLLPDGDWTLLTKPQWLSPALVQNGVSRDELLHYMRTHFRWLSYPLCAVQLAPGPWGLAEQQRWLIMPDHWPDEGVHQHLQAKP